MSAKEINISELPKLRVRTYPENSDDKLRYFERAKEFPFLLNDSLILVEGQVITSYDEFLQLAAQDSYRNSEFLDVVILNYSIPDGG